MMACRRIRGMPNTMSGSRRLTGPTLRDGMNRFQLVTMPLNHYGEKCRFVLDLLGVPYKKTVVPGILTIFL